MNKYLLSGYISVRTALEAAKRPIYSIILDKDRYDNVMRSGFHDAEKRQYAALEKYDVKIEFLSTDDFLSLGAAATSGGIAAFVGDRSYMPLEELVFKHKNYIAVLDGIEDPFNFGYALRTMYAAGVDGLILPKRDFNAATETVCRASAGASELLDITVVDSLAEAVNTAKKAGYMIISTAKTDKAKDMYRVRIKKPVCVVFGGEKRGISAEVIAASDEIIKIKYPRSCPFSLSASSAVSIISFEIAHKLSAKDNFRH